MDNLKDRMHYETSCEPKRKDHREKQEYWCRKIDEITPGINYFKFYKNTDIRIGFMVVCTVTDKEGHSSRTYYSRKTSCIKGLQDIYKQIRDML